MLETLHLVFAFFGRVLGQPRHHRVLIVSKSLDAQLENKALPHSLAAEKPTGERSQLIAVCCWVSVPPLVHLACEKTKHHAMLLGN